MSDIFELFKKISAPKVSPAPPEFLLVGLGNPGKDYATTRHNAGFIAIDCICHRKNVECSRVKFHSLVGDLTVGEHRVLLMMPQTLMNRSGIAVKEAADFYKIPPEKIIVISDDINGDPGQMRIRRSGSDGGQKGLRSIIYELGNDNFPRIKIGVGQKPTPEYDLAAWVLGKITKENFEIMRPCFEACLDAAGLIMDGDIDGAMSKYNGMNR